MDTLVSLRVFCSVTELKSFTAAADRHDISPTMASKHVRALESRLGTRLLNRTSRHVSLTETGSLYYNQARQTLDALDEAEAAVGNTTVVPRGTLRLAAPLWFDNRRFSSMLAEFGTLYPDVRFDIELTGRNVNLVEEGFDLLLRATVPGSLDQGVIARALIEMPFHLVASPAYLDRTGRPERLSDLNGRSLLLCKSLHVGATVPFELPAGREVVKFEAGFESANESLVRLVAQEGMGIAILPELMIEDDVTSGRLEKVMPDTAQIATTIYAVYPSRKFLSAKVRSFIDFFHAKVQQLNRERETRLNAP
ncbi:LysR family transcriptional regulator [Novosphingobium album (ex Hu et al. 2023)]|uniref:LysR family transcriptional regulator n=1 Tax=Novosphingobium album (ex Hu et al. 2023) TaxID=2930093 RepID=A0ABT0B793_9SPHN|nr:LysR family transcriptional regulator [Novosphingobium album (ex Hu et al. 2023)]MCJ2180942.1 LysR family transcriptional regulator [Novosphingobium album (ex Hu et al. 2023)]